MNPWDTPESQNRAEWQIKELILFIKRVFEIVPYYLREHPVLIPSGQYTDQIRVERTQQDLINEMALTLSELPPYTAYAKCITNTGLTQETRKNRVRTHKAPEGNIKVDVLLADCYTSRVEVNRRIAQRLAQGGGRPGSRPPPMSA